MRVSGWMVVVGGAAMFELCLGEMECCFAFAG